MIPESHSRHVADLLLFFLLLLTPLGVTSNLFHAAPTEIVFSPETFGTKGGVASEATECSAIGRDIIATGGNAVDAIAGATFCAGVVGMYHAGIGGGGFALVRDTDGSLEAVDFREAAPAASHQDMYRHDVRLSIVGGLAVGIPGEVLGLEYLHGNYGSMPWSDILQGAIRVARHGFRVSSDMVIKMNETFVKGRSFLVDDAVFAAEFAPNGHLLKQGDVMTRPRLARTLERIASQGSRVFYHGEIAENLVRFVQSRNGTLTLEDLSSYSVISRPVRTVRFRGLDIHGASAPASGAIALQMLEVLARYPAWRGSDSTVGGHDNDNRNLTVHRLAEVQRFGYAYRASLGDPAFDDGFRDILRYERDLLDPPTIDRIHASIHDDRTQPPASYFPSNDDDDDYDRDHDQDGTPPRAVALPESHGTSQISAADASGMAVSLTTTINLNFATTR